MSCYPLYFLALEQSKLGIGVDLLALQQRRKIVNRKIVSAAVTALYRADDGKTMLQKRMQVLALLKAALAEGREEIEARLTNGTNGVDVCEANTYLIDQLIRITYDVATSYVYPGGRALMGERLAIVAVGGYGRGQMLPYSDVDLLFVHPYKAEGWTEQVIEFILYMLWDLGLKVGHASRSIDECIRMARQDVTIKTSILENRFIYGDQPLHEELDRRFRLHAMGDTGFVKAKLAERDARHQRHGDTRYVLEPNIKEGKGGLRDLQTLYWIAKYSYGVRSVVDLESEGVLTAEEARTFRKAERFLLTIRSHMHVVMKRAEERLTFDLQPQISARLGYVDRDGLMGVERFMKHYFLVTKDVGDLTRILCAALEEKHKTGSLLSLPFRFMPRKVIGAFVSDAGRLGFRDETEVLADPVLMIELFQVAQAESLDIHPNALRFIHHNIKLVDAKMRDDRRANSLFLDIMTSKFDPGVTLRRLNEAGILGRFMPDFGRVVAQMQHDMYHNYTVDEHTIRAISTLHRIEKGDFAEKAPLATRVMPHISNRRVIYMSVLLHDIAKGRGGDHSVLGADVAREVCPRLGMSESETETVAWLVYHHLTMSMTATKRDIDDPKTVQDFVDIVQGLERLQLLAVLTTADIMAVGPQTWNAWKSQLLSDLFHRAQDLMTGGYHRDTRDRRVQLKQEELRTRLAGWDAAVRDQHIDRLPAPYWLHHSPESLEFHAGAMQRMAGAGATLWVEAQVLADQGITEVIVVGQDQPGFFSTVAGAISLGRVSIVSARIDSTRDGLAVDVFHIQDLLEGDALEDSTRIQRLYDRVHGAINKEIDLKSEIQSLRSHTLPKRSDALVVHPQVYVDFNASASHTVIEVAGRDRPGLLFALTQELVQQGMSIHNARIGTFGQRLVDVFYVRDKYGLKVSHPDKVRSLTNALMRVLQDLEDNTAIEHPDPARDGHGLIEDRGHLRHKPGTTPEDVATAQVI